LYKHIYTINCKGKLLVIDRPLVMGILNLTSDSFYDGDKYPNIEKQMLRVEQMIKAEVDIIDIGAMSSRPGAYISKPEDELKVLLPVIEKTKAKFNDSLISIDTIHSSVAQQAIEAGADIVNDISGGIFDDKMMETVGKFGNVPYVLMHMKGTPETMKSLSNYDNMILEVSNYFVERNDKAQQAGIQDVIIDPGFGFSKNIKQNFELLNRLQEFAFLNKPMLVGLSRKSLIYKTLKTTAENALNGTTVLNTVSLMKGAHILRVHDVAAAVETVKLVSALNAEDKNEV